MSVIGHSPLAGASGAAGGSADPLYVDDVFSTFLYDGNGSTQSIDNGIDLSGEGGFVWFKGRDLSISHRLYDTERGATKRLSSSLTDAESTGANDLTAFNSNGFSVGNNGGVNASNYNYVSWTFRKAPGFFDVVTYSGTGSVQNISHSLGSVPGMIMIHCRDGSHDWEVYHRSTGATKSLHLNQNDAQATDSTVWNNTTPTSSVFTVGTSSNVNQNGHGYVAYIFAHDEQSFGTNSDESVISCGTFNATSGTQVNIGWEPEFLLAKNVTSANDWSIVDTMRGFTAGNDEYLLANKSQAGIDYPLYVPTPTGFTVSFTANNDAYIYMAIRRPHKPPTAGTDVFAVQDGRDASDGTASQSTYTSGFPVDLFVRATKGGDSSTPTVVFDRLRGQKYLVFASTAAEATGSFVKMDDMDGVYRSAISSTTGLFAYMFRRAPGFFDVVAYTGTGSARTVNHNLNSVPEMMIFKSRSSTDNWGCYHSVIGATGGIQLNFANASFVASTMFNDTQPTNSVFTVGTTGITNGSSKDYIAYLFATLDGISKVGSYSGTGSNINVNCGFTAGARFVLIKRTDSSGDWYVWNTARGIVAGNDPYFLWNTIGVSASAEVTNTDYIDPLNAGFTVTSSAPAGLNASGGTYLFLAIA